MAYMSKRMTDNGVVPCGSNLFGTCSTAAGTSVKIVDLPDFDVLVAGVTIHVYFANYNYAANVYLQVGSTVAKPMRRNGSSYGVWDNGSVVSFTYDGSYWRQNDYYNTDSDTDTNTTYELSQNGNNITLTGSDGSSDTVTISAGDKIRRTSVEAYLTIGANSYTGDKLISPGVNNVLGVVGWNISNQDTDGQNASYVTLYACAYYTNYIHIQARNHANTQAKVVVRVYVLYKE